MRKKIMETIIKEISLNLKLNINDPKDLPEIFDGNLQKMESYFKNKYYLSNKLSGNNFPSSTQIISNNNILSQQMNFKKDNKSPMTAKRIINKKHTSNIQEDMNNISNQDKSYKFFNILGKVLFNKRYDPAIGDTRPFTKSEMEKRPIPKTYYDLKEIVNTLPCSENYFTNYLAENLIDHFNNIKELANVLESFSLTDRKINFKQGSIEKYTHVEQSISNFNCQLNVRALAYLNKSQYIEGREVKNRYFIINNFI